MTNKFFFYVAIFMLSLQRENKEKIQQLSNDKLHTQNKQRIKIKTYF